MLLVEYNEFVDDHPSAPSYKLVISSNVSAECQSANLENLPLMKFEDELPITIFDVVQSYTVCSGFPRVLYVPRFVLSVTACNANAASLAV